MAKQRSNKIKQAEVGRMWTRRAAIEGMCGRRAVLCGRNAKKRPASRTESTVAAMNGTVLCGGAATKGIEGKSRCESLSVDSPAT